MYERVLAAAGIAIAVSVVGCSAAPPHIAVHPATPAAPAPMAAVPAAACATSAAADPAIGTPISDPYDLLRQAHGRVRSVVARPGRIEIAAVVGDPSPQVELSLDGGKSFTPVLDRGGAGFPRVVVDCAGQLFVARDNWLGVRTVAGIETWRTFPFASRGGDAALYEVAGALVWFHGDAIGVSRDGGATWQQTPADVARALVGFAPDHRFVVSDRELDRVTWTGPTDRRTLVRFDPLRGTASHEPVDVAYSPDVEWIAAAHAEHRWEVRIHCRSQPTEHGPECLPAPAHIDSDDNRAVSELLPRLVGGSSVRDLPVTWCRTKWVGGLECALLTVRAGVAMREPYTSNGGWTGRILPETPTIGFALPASFAPGWPVGFDGDGHTLASFNGFLMRWSADSGWRVLPVGVDGATASALALAATPLAPEAADHPLAQALYAGFGAGIWSCGPSGCSLALTDVRCGSHGGVVRCDAVDNANAGRNVQATGTAAVEVNAALIRDVNRGEVATIDCHGHPHLPESPSVHYRIVGRAGDGLIDSAVTHFEVSSLGQHSRTPVPVDVRCADGSCTLATPDLRETISGRDADALSHALAQRRGERCATSGTCRVSTPVRCESSGGFADGGLTSLLACSVGAAR